MKLSVQSGEILDKFGLEEGFRMTKEAGFEAMDINLDHIVSVPQMRDGDLEWFLKLSDDELKAAYAPVKEAAAKYGITFTQGHAPFPTRVKDGIANEHMQYILEKTIMVCAYLDCPRLVVHEGSLPYGDDDSDTWDYNIKMYTGLIPALKKYGVQCCLENLFRGYKGLMMPAPCWTADESVKYLDTLNEIAGENLFGFCLDVGHAVLVKQDVYEFIHKLGHRLTCLHIHDNNGLNDQHLFPYMGVINWDRFCQALKEINYAYDLNFETFAGLRMFDPALAPEVLKLAGVTAALLRSRITN